MVLSFASKIQFYLINYDTQHIGDGDTKSYTNVVVSDPYPGIIIEKAECVGHVQKRVGTRLRKFKSDCKELMPLEYSKDKKQRQMVTYLTHKAINRLQNYSGIAIRSKSNKSVEETRKAVGAVLFHCSEAASIDSRHQFCPKSSSSWCKFQVDKVTNTHSYIDKPGLPIPLRKKLEPILELNSPDLLKKCLHGNTQNNNESLNGVIWKRCPKDIFVSRLVLEMGVSSAIINFNQGISGILNVLNGCNIESGSYTEHFVDESDHEKVDRQNRKSSEITKKRRKTLRAINKGHIDRDTQVKPSYSKGAF